MTTHDKNYGERHEVDVGEKRIDLSPDQNEAVDRILAWWRTDTTKQTFTLAGYAGTGKTTVVSRLLEQLPSRVVVAAPTAKAALRLREKGVKASTIHQAAYSLSHTDEETGDPVFDFIGTSREPPLFVVDEASMVSGPIYRDLVGAGYRMLFVGDHGQLPPVGEDPGIMRAPDFALEQIHRTDDRGLLDFAHALRKGDPRPKATGAVREVLINPVNADEVLARELAQADMVLCWKNATRHSLNMRAMNVLGITERKSFGPGFLEELEGKTIRCVGLRNDYRRQIYNGGLLDVEIAQLHGGVLHGVARDAYMDEVLGIGGRMVKIDPRGFCLAEQGYKPATGTVLLDFGYVLTVHKSQGSEAPRVAFYDDTHSRLEDRARLYYTAATRAEESLAWIVRQ